MGEFETKWKQVWDKRRNKYSASERDNFNVLWEIIVLVSFLMYLTRIYLQEATVVLSKQNRLNTMGEVPAYLFV